MKNMLLDCWHKFKVLLVVCYRWTNPYRFEDFAEVLLLYNRDGIHAICTWFSLEKLCLHVPCSFQCVFIQPTPNLHVTGHSWRTLFNWISWIKITTYYVYFALVNCKWSCFSISVKDMTFQNMQQNSILFLTMLVLSSKRAFIFFLVLKVKKKKGRLCMLSCIWL